MSKKRYVDTKFWDDSFIIDLDPIEKLLFLYFLTNPLTELSGAYEISLRRIAFDTGIDRDMVLKILSRFSKADKMHYDDGWILIVNFQTYQSLNPKIEAGIARSLTNCPTWIKDRLSKPIDRLSIGYQSLSHSNLDSDSNLDSNLDLNSQTNAAEKFEFPIRELLETFPDLELAPAQIGAIESEVKTEDAEAWRLTLEQYKLNYDPSLKQYDPRKVGTVINVFRSFQVKLAKQNGNNNGQTDERNSNANGSKRIKDIDAAIARWQA